MEHGHAKALSGKRQWVVLEQQVVATILMSAYKKMADDILLMPFLQVDTRRMTNK